MRKNQQKNTLENIIDNETPNTIYKNMFDLFQELKAKFENMCRL